MNVLELWFRRQKKHNEHFVSIQDLFFGQKTNAYLHYRVKIFNLQILIHYVFFCFFFIVNYKNLSYHNFSLIALLILIQNAFLSFWWGALETMRTSVRHDYFAHDSSTLTRTIGNYLLFAILFALCLSYVNFLIWHLYIKESSLPFIIQNFILFFFISIPFVLILRTYHAGMYAISRIVRTPLSMITPNLLGLFSLFLLYPVYKEYAALDSFIIQSIAALLLQLKFINRMYRFFDLTPTLPNLKKFWHWFKKFPIFEFTIAGTSFLFIHADIAIVGIISFLMQNGTISNTLFIIIFLIHPLLAATTDWAILFYFDRKRIGSRDFRKMVLHYDQAIGKASILFALLYWLTATIVTFLLISPEASSYFILFLPFFIVKSKLADSEIRTYSYNRYFDLLFVHAWVIFIGFLIYFLEPPEIYSYFIALLALIVAIKLLNKQRFKTIKMQNLYKLPISFFSFLYRLTLIKDQEFTVYYVTLVKTIHIHQKFHILNLISSKFLHANEEICALDDLHYLFFTRNRSILRADLFNMTSGLIKSIEKNDIFCASHLTHLLMQPRGIFSHFIPNYSSSILSFIEIKERFFQTFPQGIYFTPEPELGPEATSMPVKDTRELYMQALNYLFYSHKTNDSIYEITVCYSQNQIEGIFSVPKRQYSVQRRQHWKQFLLEQNILHQFLNPSSRVH